MRVAHIASAKREPIFFGQTCARSAHSERVSASRFFLGGGQTCARGAHSEPILGGVQGPALGPLAGCRGRAPAGGPGGGAPEDFGFTLFRALKLLYLKVILVTFLTFCLLYANWCTVITKNVGLWLKFR